MLGETIGKTSINWSLLTFQLWNVYVCCSKDGPSPRKKTKQKKTCRVYVDVFKHVMEYYGELFNIDRWGNGEDLRFSSDAHTYDESIGRVVNVLSRIVALYSEHRLPKNWTGLLLVSGVVNSANPKCLGLCPGVDDNSINWMVHYPSLEMVNAFKKVLACISSIRALTFLFFYWLLINLSIRIHLLYSELTVGNMSAWKLWK